jgi:hypothetical protein
MRKQSMLMTLALVSLLALALPFAAYGDDSDWAKSFEEATGLPGLPAYPVSEVSFNKNSPGSVTFTVKSKIDQDSDVYKAYAREVWDITKAASPDGIYSLNYDGFKRGEEAKAFNYQESIWYYTHRGYIAQLVLMVKGNTLTVRYDRVYNPKTRERSKP